MGVNFILVGGIEKQAELNFKALKDQEEIIFVKNNHLQSDPENLFNSRAFKEIFTQKTNVKRQKTPTGYYPS